MKTFTLFLSACLIGTSCLFIACSKKKEDPAPVVLTPGPAPTTVTPSSDTTSTTPNSFSDGTSTTTASIVQATKDAKTGHITVALIKAASEFPTIFLSIASPASTGTYKDDDSPNTYGQIKYSPSDSYKSDVNNGKTCVITVTTLTSSQIAGTFKFTGTQSGVSASKVVTGNFNTAYTTK